VLVHLLEVPLTWVFAWPARPSRRPSSWPSKASNLKGLSNSRFSSPGSSSSWSSDHFTSRYPGAAPLKAASLPSRNGQAALALSNHCCVPCRGEASGIMAALSLLCRLLRPTLGLHQVHSQRRLRSALGILSCLLVVRRQYKALASLALRRGFIASTSGMISP